MYHMGLLSQKHVGQYDNINAFRHAQSVMRPECSNDHKGSVLCIIANRGKKAAKIFVVQTRNYIPQCVNSVLLPKWHVIETKHTCRFGESGIGRTSDAWKCPKPTSLRLLGTGNFQPPSVCPIPDSPPWKYVCYRGKGSKLFRCHFRPQQWNTNLIGNPMTIHYT
jgi:hypothetical protein